MTQGAPEKARRKSRNRPHGDASSLQTPLHDAKLWDVMPPFRRDTGNIAEKSSRFARCIRYQKSMIRRAHTALIWCTSNEAHPELTASQLRGAIQFENCGRIRLRRPRAKSGCRVHSKMDEPASFEQLTREMCRKIHTDTDRWFVVGADAGSDAAWMSAIWHAHLFAGAIIISGYPHVPYPEQLDPMLLENLRGVAILSIWTAPSENASDDRTIRVAMHNRALVAMAKNAKVQ